MSHEYLGHIKDDGTIQDSNYKTINRARERHPGKVGGTVFLL